MTKLITHENRDNELNDKIGVEMPNPSIIGSPEDTDPVHNANNFKPGSTIKSSIGYNENEDSTANRTEKIKPSSILRSFKGYNGKGDVFEVLTDPDTGDQYIVDPKMKGGPKGVSSYKMISLFKDQLGKPHTILFPDPELKQRNVWRETVEEFLGRATMEWVTLPKEGDGPVPEKFDLPEPIPFDFSYSVFLDIMFGDKTIDSLDHPLMQRLMARESYNTKD